MEQNELLSAVKVEEPVTIVIFGASGDLTRRKLIPALYAAFVQHLLPDPFSIVAFARREWSDEHFRSLMKESLRAFSRIPPDEEQLQLFTERMVYHRGDLTQVADYETLRERMEQADACPNNRLYYLSISPDLFSVAVQSLSQSGLIASMSATHWTRVVIEKPFGHNLESAKQLNTALLRYLDESQIYRIDHYLGKETVQNILSFRFANAIFEPVFNRSFVDHIQITASESIGVESGRGGYYDDYGAIRDMITNHLLQLLCLVTMEPPGALSAEAVRNEKVKVLNAISLDIREEISDAVCRGQYSAGVDAQGDALVSYREEERVDPASETETFAALRLKIDNWRWAGVPIFIRTGKRMKKKMTEIAIQFKVPPLQLFQQVECREDVCDMTGIKPNTLIFRIQPDEGLFLQIDTKRPGMQFVVEDAKMDFSYSGRWKNPLPEAYERLLLDTLLGDRTLFTRSDEVEAEWTVVQPILDQLDALKTDTYLSGEWGLPEADRLFQGHSGAWRND